MHAGGGIRVGQAENDCLFAFLDLLDLQGKVAGCRDGPLATDDVGAYARSGQDPDKRVHGSIR